MTRFRSVLLACVLLAAAGIPAVSDPGFFYYRDGDDLIITNDPPLRGGAQRVPGLELPTPRPAAEGPVTPYDPFIERVARENGLSPSLIKAVARVESGFDPRAVSTKGAQGLMQLMPATARQYGVSDAFNPLENLRAGATHLRKLLDEFDGDLTLALAAYNAGSGAVRRHGGVQAYRETRDYVRRVHDSMGRRTRRPHVQPRPDPVRLVRGSDGSLTLTN